MPVDPVSDGADAVSLRALGTLGDLELHALRLVQRLVAVGVDGGVVNEHIGAAAVLGDETKALFSVEPLDGALCHGVNLFLLGAMECTRRAFHKAALRPPTELGQSHPDEIGQIAHSEGSCEKARSTGRER